MIKKLLDMVMPLIDTEVMAAEIYELSEIEKFTDFDSFEKAVGWLEEKYAALGSTIDRFAMRCLVLLWG